MKSFIIALLILALLIVGFWVYHDRLEEIVTSLCAYAEAGDIPELDEAFSRAKPMFDVFLNHQEVATLEDSLSRLRVLYREGSKSDLLCEQSLFISRLRGLYENEDIHLSNLF